MKVGISSDAFSSRRSDGDGAADADGDGTAASENETPRFPPAVAPAPFLQVRALSKRLGQTAALIDVSLDVFPDELLVVLGPTGAGKTTLLRTIAGLERPDAGTVHMGGVDVTPLDPSRRDVAFVFQNFSLYPRWTVRRNLEFPLRAPGRALDDKEIHRRVESAADTLKLSRLLDREASRLSGGEMQRVAIGRAIVRRPRLFLLDEPLTNLDAKLRESLRVELVELRRKLQTPMVFVTHDQTEALSMADRIVVLSEGRVLQVGTPREIYEGPRSPLVALQLGQPPINLVPARRAGGSWCAADGTPLMPARETGPDQCLLGFRPEDVAPQLPGDAAPGTPLALVKVVEYIGPTTTLLCQWAGSEVHVVIPRRGIFRPGHQVALRIDADRSLLFDLPSNPDPPGGAT